jgi:hypothetical protein
MLTAYTMAPPPAALPAMGGVIAAAGASLVYTALLVVLAVVVGVLVQNAVARPARRASTVRIVVPPDARQPVRQPA